MRTFAHRISYASPLAMTIIAIFLWWGETSLAAATVPLERDSSRAMARNAAPFLLTSNQITITSSGFNPTVITVTAGTTVAWYNSTATTQILESGTPSFSYFLPLVVKNLASPSAAQKTAARLAPGALFPATIPSGGTYTYLFASVGDYPFYLRDAPQFRCRVVVQQPPQPDFMLSAQPTSRSVVQGNSTTYTVNVTGTNGFNTAVNLSVSGLPSGASATFAANPLVPTASTLLTIATQPATTVGAYPLTLLGNSGTLSHSNNVTLSVLASELVQDGGFEAGLPNPYWKTASNKSSSILDNSSIPQPNPTHSGAWKAWLGGDNDVQESLWQTITVPSGTTSLQVSFWWQVNTTEPNPLVDDRLDVQLRDSTGATVLTTMYTLFDGDANSTWVQETLSASSYAGQTIQIAFVADTDASYPTNFFIDDVSIIANQ